MPLGLTRHPHLQNVAAGPATGASRQEAKIRINATAARRLLVTVAAIGALLWAPPASARVIGALPANEVRCVALNIYHEARGEPLDGQVADRFVQVLARHAPELGGAVQGGDLGCGYAAGQSVEGNGGH